MPYRLSAVAAGSLGSTIALWREKTFQALADLLEVGPGDLVTVEVLEGARPVRQVPVVQLIEQHMGTAAYLRLDAVQRLVGRERAISGARLAKTGLEPRSTSTLSGSLFPRIYRAPSERVGSYTSPSRSMSFSCIAAQASRTPWL